MAAKKITKKKVSMKKSAKFSLDIKTREDAETLTIQMMELKLSAGWAILAKMLENSMAVMERAIITKVDPETFATLSEAQLDELRGRHKVFDEVLKKPDQLIESFKKQSPMHMPTYDPYHVDYKAMMKEKKTDVQEDSPSTLKM